MPLKQTSLFDFDSEPEDDNQPEQQPVVQEEAVALVINEEPVEVDFTPAPVKQTETGSKEKYPGKKKAE
jgi:hypothetical protein